VLGWLVTWTWTAGADKLRALCISAGQASFNPPGITIAVKKDRGMETMLQPGNTFAVSMVPESLEKPIMKVGR
jgi:flavin reductase (DIM6/NTAB) family NADH-FMN oxidoreductase RutF